MSQVIIKRVGTNFEISNGTIVLQGPNRSQLLAALDMLEAMPANLDAIQAKVDKAAEQVRKVIAEKKAAEPKPAAPASAPAPAPASAPASAPTTKSGVIGASILGVLAGTEDTDGLNMREIMEKVGYTGAPQPYASTLSSLFKKKLLKRKKVAGVWSYRLK